MGYKEKDIKEIVDMQRDFFLSNQTLDIDWRIVQLKKLKKAIISHEKELLEALSKDLGRSEAEAYFCDIGTSIMEINEMIKGVRRWSKPKSKFSGFICFPSVKTKIYKMPYGVSLIISPFNFPIYLTFGVLATSIAAGNTAVIKASSKSENCTNVMKKLIEETFPKEFVTLIDGGHDVADMCLAQRFDKIFYTGSPNIGKHVLRAAAENLTPVALELGGETGNWAVIRSDADLRDAARKIAFFKLCNSGQICININQVAVASDVADEFIDELKKEYERQIGKDAAMNKDYPRLISESSYKKCDDEVKKYSDKVVYGGKGDIKKLKYSPTIIYPVSVDEEIVNHELFNPILPIVSFNDKDVDALMDTIAKREHGLALYLFTKNKSWAKNIMATQQFGGGCVNEVCLHMMVKGAPFNGTGHSGMGAYHGKWGFDEFTHPKTVLYGSTKFNLSLREHPYDKKKLNFLKKFEK